MKSQNANEMEKDEDFDFFKNSKTSNKSSNQPNNKPVLEKRPNIDKLKHNLLINIKSVVVGLAIPLILIGAGLIIVSVSKKTPTVISSPAIVAPKVQPIIIEAKPSENPNEPFKVDYSKVSKEDAERIKQALKGFQDINKQLQEIKKEVQPKN